MNRSIALTYAVAGLAVAVALVAIVGATVGLFDTRTPFTPGGPATASLDPAPALVASVAPIPADPALADPAAGDAGAEIVYVDAPAPRRHGDDDDHEHEGRGGHHRHHGDEGDDD
ncbi:MAG: hypothetical protein H6745_21340 [Deltaproteobacteria bacterium]|nr:hypothetical protein [Deltaproteobacteria bacterium]